MICEACGHEQDRGRFCGRCGARVEAADQPAPRPSWTRPERLVPAALALVVLVLALGRLLDPGPAGGNGATPQGPPDRSAVRTPASSATPTDVAPTPFAGAVFPDGTATVLFIDDGSDGVVGLDLDAGTSQHVELPGQRAGDRPHRLWRLGHQLVVGQEGHVVALPGADGGTRTLGTATGFLPAADPQQLWVADAAGGWTLVTASGGTVASLDAIPGYEAVRGLPRGLALRDRTGRLWRYDIAEDVLVEALGEERPRWIGDVVRSQVAWCSADPCRRLSVADAGGAEAVAIGGGEAFSEGQVWLSPAGDQVAAVVGTPGGDGAGVDRRLRVYRTATGEVLADAPVPLGEVFGSWTVDGRQFFGWVHASATAPGAPSVLARWAGTSIELVDARSVGVDDVRGVVALPQPSVRGVFRGGATCAESDRSDAMGSLPAWRGDEVHVALLRPGGTEPPDQLWVGIPGAGSATTVTVSARLADGQRQAEFRTGGGADWRTDITMRGGTRTADGFPPHWGLASRFPEPGCWAVTVSTEELTETVTLEIEFDIR
ncbi:MAG: hypothetical protein KY457_12875 [Actinobacteria bacterium]|nr:hypothetical protein [Actinomycetota bacterium]